MHATRRLRTALKWSALGRYLILDWKAPDGVRLVSWAFVLEPLDDPLTRLIVRARGGAIAWHRHTGGIEDGSMNGFFCARLPR
jgi:hypothetical protein